MRRVFVDVLLIICLLTILGTVEFFVWQKNQFEHNNQVPANTGYKNLSYVIEGKPVQLVNGHEEHEAAPESASKIVTDYFGNEGYGDINADGRPDVAFLLTQQGGGSGTFFYLAAALSTADGYTSLNTVFLGDRIAPQSTEVKDGVVIVNYAERAQGDSMTTPPSHGVSRYFAVENGVLTEKFFHPVFGVSQKLSLHEVSTFDDGLKVTLYKIDDSRCKKPNVCIWAGELSPHFTISGGKMSKETDLVMGTATKSNATIDGYHFVLQEATEATVTILVTAQSLTTGGCYIGGCSSQICSDQKDIASTCEYRASYACYKTAKCERQNDGKCDWTNTSELRTCLANVK